MAHPEIKQGDNAKAVVARYAAALRLANSRIIKVRNCERTNRRQFAQQKKP